MVYLELWASNCSFEDKDLLLKWALAVEACRTLVDVVGLYCTFRYKLGVLVRGSGFLLFGGSFRDLGDIWAFRGLQGFVCKRNLLKVC